MPRRSNALLLTPLVGFLLLGATMAHAIDMVLYQESDGGGRGGASTEAFFNDGPITGTGSEAVQVDILRVTFSVYPGWREARIQLAVPPWPEKTILAHYQDGIFNSLGSVDRGGNNSVAIDPASNWLGENISFGHNVLRDIPCCAGFHTYSLLEYSSPTPVPEPASMVLFMVGGLMLAGRRTSSRRRHRS